MKLRQKRRIRQRLQTLLFGSILIWMVASFIAAVPARALHRQSAPDILSEYARVESYRGYVYGLEGADGAEAIAKEENGTTKLLCKAASAMSAVDLVQACGVPIGIARHLRVLSHKDMAHDIVVTSM
ncbi:MAG: hypothetical protein HLUCCA11_18950 [Phormidesmis priestleyi Ana]|uniref:Uncharacterized protein n=1 Tax=Phormidesmis priestleyi Ana TaxID=1666911 RepID=A0A0P7YRV9_9CYAN|nr:MAG: hypothetical protein HLUCCA11_18950 [Phormidesmis priestleyi Ana]